MSEPTPQDIEKAQELAQIEFYNARVKAIAAEITRLRSAPPVTEEMVEQAARALVPFSYGAFENQGRFNGKEWVDRPPPGTPREHARNAARAALVAALGTGGESA